MSKIQKSNFISNIEFIFSWFIVFVLGIEVGFFLFEYLYIYHTDRTRLISIQIDPFQIITLIVSLILSVYLLRKLGRKDSLKTNQLSRLSNSIETSNKNLRKFTDSISTTESLSYSLITMKMKIYRMKFNNSLELCQEEGVIEAQCSNATQLKENLHDILELLTNTPQNKSANSKRMSLKEGNIRFTDSALFELEVLMTKNDTLMYHLVNEISSQ